MLHAGIPTNSIVVCPNNCRGHFVVRNTEMNDLGVSDIGRVWNSITKLFLQGKIGWRKTTNAQIIGYGLLPYACFQTRL